RQPQTECCPFACRHCEGRRTVPLERRMRVGERAVAFLKIVPQSRCRAGLLRNARPAFPLLGYELGEKRFHEAGQIVRDTLGLLYQILTQCEVDRPLANRTHVSALHFRCLPQYAHRMRILRITQGHLRGRLTVAWPHARSDFAMLSPSRLTALPVELPTQSPLSFLAVLTWRACATLERNNTAVVRCGIDCRVLSGWRRENPASRSATASHGTCDIRSLGPRAPRQRLVLRAPILRQAHGEWRSDESAQQQRREPDPPARNRGESHQRCHREERHHHDRRSRSLHQGSYRRLVACHRAQDRNHTAYWRREGRGGTHSRAAARWPSQAGATGARSSQDPSDRIELPSQIARTARPAQKGAIPGCFIL